MTLTGWTLKTFSLRAFDISKLLTRMLPGSIPCELRLMLPDSKIEDCPRRKPGRVSYLAITAYFPRGCYFSPLTMAEGCIQDYATALEGGGAAPSFRSGQFGMVDQDFAQSVRSRSPLPWTST